MKKMMKQVAALFTWVLVWAACFTSTVQAATLSEIFDMYKLAKAHADGTITLSREEI
jgi:hypothetical protein